MKPTDKQLAELTRILKATADEEINCAEFLDQIAPYVQALTNSADMAKEFQQIAQHLAVCPECQQEFTALLKAEGIDPQSLK